MPPSNIILLIVGIILVLVIILVVILATNSNKHPPPPPNGPSNSKESDKINPKSTNKDFETEEDSDSEPESPSVHNSPVQNPSVQAKAYSISYRNLPSYPLIVTGEKELPIVNDSSQQDLLDKQKDKQTEIETKEKGLEETSNAVKPMANLNQHDPIALFVEDQLKHIPAIAVLNPIIEETPKLQSNENQEPLDIVKIHSNFQDNKLDQKIDQKIEPKSENKSSDNLDAKIEDQKVEDDKIDEKPEDKDKETDEQQMQTSQNFSDLSFGTVESNVPIREKRVPTARAKVAPFAPFVPTIPKNTQVPKIPAFQPTNLSLKDPASMSSDFSSMTETGTNFNLTTKLAPRRKHGGY